MYGDNVYLLPVRFERPVQEPTLEGYVFDGREWHKATTPLEYDGGNELAQYYVVS